MPASVIPVTGLTVGPVGKISQTDFPLITPRVVKSTDTKNLTFGEAAVLNTDGTYSSVAQFIAGGGSLTSATPLGVAVQNIKTNAYYPLAGGQAMAGGAYVPGNLADVLVRGTINVKINAGATPSAGGEVYVRVAANGGIPAGVVGGFESAADGENTVVITNMVFKTGTVETDGTAQITLLNRTMA